MEMDYHICDKITWKESLLLLKEDLYAQRVYSTLWKMTKDVFHLALPISGIASLAILIPALISPPGTWWETSCVVVFVPISFLKGKNIPNFRLSENSMSYRLHYKPLPSPKEVKELMDLLIYLAHRFSLELITEEELYKEAMQEEKQNAGKAS